MSISTFRLVGSVLLGLNLWGVAQAQTWVLTDTRRQVWADTSYTPAEWQFGAHSAAALKRYVTGDGRPMAISITCEWQGIPGSIAAGASFPVSVKLEQRQNTQTGYTPSLKLYAGQEGGAESDGPEVVTGWREGPVTHTASGQLTAPRGGPGAFYIRAHCGPKDYVNVYYIYRLDPGAAAPAPAVPAAPAAAPAGAVNGVWAGAWQTDFGAMRLQVEGGRVVGRYDYKNGRIEGVIEGNTMRGRWVQDNAQGGFIFRLSPDGRSFDGRWGRGASETDGGPWAGRR